MAKYKKHIAGSKTVAMVHLSRDQDKKSAEQWAAKEQFPWFAVLPKNAKRSSITADYYKGGVPQYTLVDKSGKVIASGSRACFEKIKELGKRPEEKEEQDSP